MVFDMRILLDVSLTVTRAFPHVRLEAGGQIPAPEMSRPAREQRRRVREFYWDRVVPKLGRPATCGAEELANG